MQPTTLLPSYTSPRSQLTKEPAPLRVRPIRRSSAATLAFSATGLGASILAYVVPVFVGGALAYATAIPLALVAVLFFVGAHHAAWRAECPACERRLRLPADHQLVLRCRGCAHEIEARAGLLRLHAPR